MQGLNLLYAHPSHMTLWLPKAAPVTTKVSDVFREKLTVLSHPFPLELCDLCLEFTGGCEISKDYHRYGTWQVSIDGMRLWVWKDGVYSDAVRIPVCTAQVKALGPIVECIDKRGVVLARLDMRISGRIADCRTLSLQTSEMSCMCVVLNREPWASVARSIGTVTLKKSVRGKQRVNLSTIQVEVGSIAVCIVTQNGTSLLWIGTPFIKPDKALISQTEKELVVCLVEDEKIELHTFTHLHRVETCELSFVAQSIMHCGTCIRVEGDGEFVAITPGI